MEGLIYEASQPLAFAKKGEAQWGFCLAADYDDEWTKTFHKDGRIKTAMRVWHICMAGDAGQECYTVIEGKAWRRLHQGDLDAWCSGQQWYCNCCNARYHPSMGVLLEIHTAVGDIFWMLATYPFETKDVKWMRIEEDMGEVATPEELFNRSQCVSPYLGDNMLRPVERRDLWPGLPMPEGVYKVVEPAYLKAVPTWSFNDIIAFAKMSEQGPK